MELNTEIFANYVEEANKTCIPTILQLIQKSGPLIVMFRKNNEGFEKEKILEVLMNTFYFVFFKKFKGQIQIGPVIQEIVRVFRFETSSNWKNDWKWRSEEIDEEVLKKCRENNIQEDLFVIYNALCYQIDITFIGKVDDKPRGFFLMIFDRISSGLNISPFDAAILITKITIEVLNELAIQEFQVIFDELKKAEAIRYEQEVVDKDYDMEISDV